MQYRHSFHAGNFADVHKHIALLALISALQKKAKGFLFLDTHAGEGLYDLAGVDARRSAESEAGIARFLVAAQQPPDVLATAIQDYLRAIASLRERLGGSTHIYPGSPLLAATALREADQCVFVETLAQQARALQRVVDQPALQVRTPVRVVSGDGYQQLKALMPPAQRRGLVLIDPPYENADEEKQIASAFVEALTRFETGVYALWYPIKKQHDTDLWLARITRDIQQPVVAIELCMTEPDSAVGLNGSGVLVINPPWQFDVDAAHWQPQLHDLLGGKSGTRVHWLVKEPGQ
jgi:23S rRNA (adenine2030-N6)-methyltransferase